MADAGNTPSDALKKVLGELRQNYIAGWPEKKKRMEDHLAGIRGGTDPARALAGLRLEFHRIAGTGTTYGFPGVTKVGREAERLVEALTEAGGRASAGDIARIAGLIASLDGFFPPGG